ncbi:MAG: polysaccharide biosynthesis/export family protein, partial [Gallionella sp.]
FRCVRLLFVFTSALALMTGCSTYPGWISSSGASREQVQNKQDAPGLGGIQLVEVNATLTRQLRASRKANLFSESFGLTTQPNFVVGAGDVLEVSVWEAPPAMLFGGAAVDPRMGPATTRVTTFPEQMVSSDGTINIPFVGHVPVDQHDPQWIEEEIAKRLQHKANQPQIMVRVIKNATSTVTVVGEVSTSGRMPLTARGERLLDALATSGGVRQPVNKMTLQVTRGNLVQSLPLQTIIQDPKQNIVLQPGDVITALYQPLSFSVLGATGKNEEVNFETQGISLAQALARSGGLNDSRADARGVFIFRFEDEKALDWPSAVQATQEGKVAVIYEVDLRDPASFFVAQGFTVQNGDVLYVSNAPAAELQKFMNIVTTAFYPLFVAKTLKPNI